jgi:hypothetical protein
LAATLEGARSRDILSDKEHIAKFNGRFALLVLIGMISALQNSRDVGRIDLAARRDLMINNPSELLRSKAPFPTLFQD